MLTRPTTCNKDEATAIRCYSTGQIVYNMIMYLSSIYNHSKIFKIYSRYIQVWSNMNKKRTTNFAVAWQVRIRGHLLWREASPKIEETKFQILCNIWENLLIRKREQPSKTRTVISRHDLFLLTSLARRQENWLDDLSMGLTKRLQDEVKRQLFCWLCTRKSASQCNIHNFASDHD